MAEGPTAHKRWFRVKALFSRALELPRDSVPVWLDAECGDDLELRAELESLLASHWSDPGFMALPAIAGLGAARAIAEHVGAGAQAAMIGRRLGPYRLVSELGRGGMGVVYLAERDDQAFNRQVAIKMVYGAVLQPSLADRFEAERRILARFEHPNIARLFDAGTDESGMPFAVIEYVEGIPIDTFVRDRQLPVASRLELFCDVCDAVQYSHERLVVHRDIKPANVLVTAEGVPKLLDFGIAKLLDPSGARTDQTRTDLRALTPESASPEQIRGDPITVASDVYSLGVLLFRLLAGTSPYRPKSATDVEISRVICEEDPRKPSEAVADGAAGLSPRDIAARRRELRGDLDRITLKALRKEPERRYSSVDQLARDIRRYLAGQPVEAVPDSRRYRVAKFLRRNRAGVAVAAVIVATIIAGLTATLLQARVARTERERAERRFNDVRALASALIFELHDAIEPLPGSTAARELLIRRALGYLDRLAAESAADPSLQREIASAYARIALIQGDAGYANPADKKAAHESYRGFLLYRGGNVSGALTQFEQARATREEQVRAEPGDVRARASLASAIGRIASTRWILGDRESALSARREALQHLEQLAATMPADVSVQQSLAEELALLGIGHAELGSGRPNASDCRSARPFLVRAIDSYRTLAATSAAVAIITARLSELQATLARCDGR